MKKLIILGLLFTSSLFSASLEEKAIVVIIPSYNNQRWCNWNVRSVLTQDYKNFRVIYVDDCSRDSTSNRVANIATKYGKHPKRSFSRIYFDDQNSKDLLNASSLFQKQVNQSHAFFKLVTNKNRVGALANLYRAIWSCSDDEIVVTLDGDDWFSDTRVLQRLNEAYSSGEVWLAHGGMVEYPSGSNLWCEAIQPEVIENNTFRSFKCPSHLRTFYAGLFKKIKLEDLTYEGDFFSMTWDMAMMYPMIEMCRERHAFISSPTYIYNMINPINDNKIDAELQRMLDEHIRGMEPYQRLESLTFLKSS